MVHGHEESDFAIVAVKPANKVAHPAVEQSAMGPAAAEPVEPRAETKGNADQQSTCRAQSRVLPRRSALTARPRRWRAAAGAVPGGAPGRPQQDVTVVFLSMFYPRAVSGRCKYPLAEDIDTGSPVLQISPADSRFLAIIKLRPISATLLPPCRTNYGTVVCRQFAPRQGTDPYALIQSRFMTAGGNKCWLISFGTRPGRPSPEPITSVICLNSLARFTNLELPGGETDYKLPNLRDAMARRSISL